VQAAFAQLLQRGKKVAGPGAGVHRIGRDAGGIADTPFLAGPDVYATIVSWPGLVVKDAKVTLSFWKNWEPQLKTLQCVVWVKLLLILYSVR